MRHLSALALAGAFALGMSSAALAGGGCSGMYETASTPAPVASADQAAPSTKVTTPKSGS